ncbi:MAG: Lcl C-terminal domain-containing protein [Candidatus Electronema sp. VV]
MNDTGIIPPTIGISGQEDADFGRDKTVIDPTPSDGHAGFSFTKLSSSGTPLAASATSWSCVKDNVTGLIWEHKTAPIKLSWYNSDAKTNGGNVGDQNGGNNTQSYAVKANTDSLCGKSTGWRVPTIKELVGLLNSSKIAMAADQSYFQGINTNNKFFWSATPSASLSTQAWGVDFESGYADRLYTKAERNAISIMLVRTAE